MSKEIEKILDDLAERFGVIIDWTDKNVVPYMKELFEKIMDYHITLNIIQSSIAFVIFLAGLIVVIKCGLKLYKECQFCHSEGYLDTTYRGKEALEAKRFVLGTTISIAGGFMLCGFTSFMVNLEDLIASFTLPEKFVIQELRGLW